MLRVASNNGTVYRLSVHTSQRPSLESRGTSQPLLNTVVMQLPPVQRVHLYVVHRVTSRVFTDVLDLISCHRLHHYPTTRTIHPVHGISSCIVHTIGTLGISHPGFISVRQPRPHPLLV